MKGVKQKRINIVQASQTNVEESLLEMAHKPQRVTSTRTGHSREGLIDTCFLLSHKRKESVARASSSKLYISQNAQTHYNDVKMRCQERPRGKKTDKGLRRYEEISVSL